MLQSVSRLLVAVHHPTQKAPLLNCQPLRIQEDCHIRNVILYAVFDPESVTAKSSCRRKEPISDYLTTQQENLRWERVYHSILSQLGLHPEP